DTAEEASDAWSSQQGQVHRQRNWSLPVPVQQVMEMISISKERRLAGHGARCHQTETVQDRQPEPENRTFGRKPTQAFAIGSDRSKRDKKRRRIGTGTTGEKLSPEIEINRHQTGEDNRQKWHADIGAQIIEKEERPDDERTQELTVHAIGHVHGVYESDDHK